MRNKLSLGVLILCMGLVFTACAKTATTVVEEDVATPVEVTVVSKFLIKNEYVYSGKVKPINEVNVLSTVNGTVDGVNFNVGDKVSSGDVLFTMKTEDITNNIKTLNASLASSQANINSAKISLELVNGASMQSQIEAAKAAISNAEIAVSNAEIAVSNAEIAVNNAELGVNNAQTNYNNNKALYEVNAVSKTVFDGAETSLNQANNAYSQAENAFSQTKNGLDQAGVAYNQAKTNYDIVANKMPAENKKKAEAALKIAEASRGSVLAQIESAQKSLRDAKVASPISGIVIASNVKAGTVLSQSVAPFTIIDTSKVSIHVSVSEQMINAIKMDDEVDVKIASVSAENIKGKIYSINPAATTVGTYDVKIEIDNTSDVLKSGMLGEVYFTREKSDNAVVLPRNAVITKDNETYVFVEENGVAKKTVVTTGVDNGNEIEITTGIEENTKVITRGQNYLSDGDAVSVSSMTEGE